MDYFDFDLHLSTAANGYRARATNAQGANVSADFALPFSDQDIEILMLRVGRARKNRALGRGSADMQAALNFGAKLFDTVFAGEVLALWRSSLHSIPFGQGLRVRVFLTDTPDLLDLPWEFLYDKQLNRFVAMSNKTPLVRYPALPTPVRPFALQLPLRILAMISNPIDAVTLDAELEWRNLQTALRVLQARGLVILERLDTPTYSALQRKLRNEYHVFHFVGHGGLSERTNEGVLVFTDEQGRAQDVGALKLAHLFGDCDSLRLVLLNACEGARSTRQDPFASVAASLVQHEIPAVVAMQFEISDQAALQFSNEFYTTLAEGNAVDTAMSEARKAIWGVNDLEWGTPVLYMRAPDGVIFDLSSAPPPPKIAELKPERAKPVAESKPESQKEEPRIQVIAPEQKIITPPPPKIEIPARLTNKAGQEMILIPAGEFLMGTTDAQAKRIIQQYGKDWEKWLASEQPQHKVYLDAFYISRYPVTNAEYKKFKSDWNIRNGEENHPVVNVSWNDAAAYCKWLSEQAADKETGKQGTFRLPTEAEWEKAASWDDAKKIKRIYPWGDEFDKNKCNTSESSIRGTTPVRKYSPWGDSFNGVGDMAGNVWEWCADSFDENFYKISPRENPRNDSPSQYRVLRGGSFNNEAPIARCAWPNTNRPDYLSRNLGFRVAVPPA